MLGIPHPYLTHDIPGVGGRIRVRLEDFVVEEVPLYAACGEGEHVYFELEKRDLSTLEALEWLADALGRRPRDFGYAGLKDRKGVTRQTVSLAGTTPEEILALEIPKMKILWARRHGNKLRVGHLVGNRFAIRVRGISADADERIEEILARVAAAGIPNYFGPQRFGNRGDAQWIGAAQLRHDHRGVVDRVLGRPASTEHNPRVVSARYLYQQYRWVEALERFPAGYRDERTVLRYLLRHGPKHRGACRQLRPEMVRLFFSAFQSYVFNIFLERRLQQFGDLSMLLDGDVALLHRNGAVFVVEDAAAERERVESFEISASGPIFGKKMVVPRGAPAEMEANVLEAIGVRATDFHQLEQRCHLDGARRPLRVPVREISWRREGEDLALSFFLPKGAYATTLLREIMKNDIVPEAYHGGASERWTER